jgi:hypothetical protein
MKIRNKLEALALAGLVTLTGCMDLEVLHPNAPDRERALRNVNDIEQLIAGGYRRYYDVGTASTGIGPILATASYQHTGTAANFGMVDFSFPGSAAVHHRESDPFYSEFANNWLWLYRGVAAVTEGLATMAEANLALPTEGPDGNRQARAQAYGYFVLGLTHGGAAMLFDQSYIYDPSINIEDVALAPYTEVHAAAQGYLDRAIQEATGKTFTVPREWMGRDVTAAELVRLAYSYKARFRVATARTPDERRDVNWGQVIQDIDRGITSTFAWDMRQGSGWSSGTFHNIFRLGAWGQASYFIYGMADQSGQYQRWIARDHWDRHPMLNAAQDGDPFLIITPDNRFPQGATIAAQQLNANRGRYLEILNRSGGYAQQWVRPDRGPFRWSFYRVHRYDQWATPGTNRHDWEEMPIAEMRLLRAEALYRTGDRAGAAAIVNQTRVAAGLNETNADGLNTSCVPKLPNGSCGDLFEMLKWENRMENMYKGYFAAPWYFHGRGWGDLAEGTPLQLPVPGREAELLRIPLYTFGSVGGPSAAPRGTYGH